MSMPTIAYLQLQRFQQQDLKRKMNLEKEQENQYRTETSPSRYQFDMHERQSEEVKKKWKWIEQQQEWQNRKKLLKEYEGLTFHPQILQHSKNLNKGQIRSPQQFYLDALKYKQGKLDQAQQIKTEIENKQKQELTFNPLMCQKSLQMVQQDFYDRLEEKKLVKQSKLQQIYKSTTPSFTPKTNVKKHKDTNIFNKTLPINKSKSPTRDQIQFEHIVKEQFKTFERFEEVRKSQSPVNDKAKVEMEQLKQIFILAQKFKENEVRVQRSVTPPKNKQQSIQKYTPIVTPQKKSNSPNSTIKEFRTTAQKKNYFQQDK
ncbi:hypothetical protein pb186bvf_015077 [Paramecium bursaria]